MTRVRRRRADRSRAQALIEFAIAVPFFLVLLFALIDVVRLEFSYISLSDASREMARVGAVASNASDTVVNRFNNYATVLGAMNAATDSITITVSDRTCAAAISAGNTCSSPDLPTSVTCTLPLTTAGCTIPSRSNLAGGTIDVSVNYRFNCNPLFQNRLSNIVDVSFMTPYSTLTTVARAYLE